MASEHALVRRDALGDLHGELARAGGDAVRIERVHFRSVLNLRGTPGDTLAGAVQAAFGVALPLTPCRWNGEAEHSAIWLGPDEWLLVASDGPAVPMEGVLRRACAGDSWLSVTDVSHHYTTFRLSGSRVRELLAQGCAHDFHPAAFGPGDCVQTLFARTGALLRALEDGAVELWVRNSFAYYLAKWLSGASAG